MNIVTAINASFEKYGSKVEIISGDSVSTTKGFVQPLSYKNSNYYIKDGTDVSIGDEMRYMLYAKADTKMTQNDIVKFDNTLYRVLVWQKYVAKDSCVYKWAIMKGYEPEQEDDFCA